MNQKTTVPQRKENNTMPKLTWSKMQNYAEYCRNMKMTGQRPEAYGDWVGRS